MAQQQHSSEIKVTLNDSAVNGAIRRMVDGFKKVGQAGAQAFKQATPQGTYRDAQGRLRNEQGQYIAEPRGGIRGRGLIGGIVGGLGAVDRGLNRGVDLVNRGIDSTIGFGISAGASGARALLTGDTTSAIRATGAIGANAMTRMGLGEMAGAVPFVGDIAGSLIQRRMARIGQVAGVERAQTELALGGAGFGDIRGARRRFAQMGISASEGVGALRTFQRALGERSELFGGELMGDFAQSLAEMQLRGVDAGALGQFARGGAMGGGALGNTTQSMVRAMEIISASQNMGMTGAGAQRLLSAIASNTQRIASEGLQINEDKMARAVLGISDEARRRGFRQLEGMGAMGTYQRLAGGIGGIGGGFRSQFGGLARGALIASASQGARSPLDVMRNLERFRTDPLSAISALREQGVEGDMLRMALSGLGLSLDQVDVLMGAGERERISGARLGGQATMRRGMAFSRMIQGREERLLSTVERDPASANAILSLNESMEKFALSLTKSNGLLISAINEGLRPAIETLIEKFEQYSDDPTQAIRDLISPF